MCHSGRTVSITSRDAPIGPPDPLSGAGLLGLLRESVYSFPEAPPGLLFVLCKLRERSGIANAGEVGVLLPVLEGWRDPGLHRGRAGVEDLGPFGQLDLEPAEGLATELRLRGFVGGRFVLTLPGGGQGGV